MENTAYAANTTVNPFMRGICDANPATASATLAIRRLKRPRYGIISTPVQVQAVATAFAVVVDVYDLLRLPRAEFKIVGDNSRAFLQLLFENRRDLVIADGKQIDSDQIGGGVVLLQQVAVDNVRGGRKFEIADFIRALAGEGVIQFDAGRVGLILSRRRDDKAPIAGSQIEHFLACFQPAELQHFVDDNFGSRIIGREFIGSCLLGLNEQGWCKKQNGAAAKTLRWPHLWGSLQPAADF